MKTIPILLALGALAACGGPDPVANDASNADSLPTVNAPAPNPSGAAPAGAKQDDGSEATSFGEIPSTLHGRWGLTPADCTSTRGDAKGLLVIDAEKLQFYESRAVPSPGIEMLTTSVTGNFLFTGEGQEWTKYEALDLQGDKLVRTERDPSASFTYVRC
jgi:hypothetical protein